MERGAGCLRALAPFCRNEKTPNLLTRCLYILPAYTFPGGAPARCRGITTSEVTSHNRGFPYFSLNRQLCIPAPLITAKNRRSLSPSTTSLTLRKQSGWQCPHCLGKAQIRPWLGLLINRCGAREPLRRLETTEPRHVSDRSHVQQRAAMECVLRLVRLYKITAPSYGLILPPDSQVRMLPISGKSSGKLEEASFMGWITPSRAWSQLPGSE
jgi:hypothetical protein